MTIGLQIFLPPCPGVAASYALRVPQAEDLPTASFRPHLTMIALAVQLTVPVIRGRGGLSPPSECALPGAPKGKGPPEAVARRQGAKKRMIIQQSRFSAPSRP